MFKFDQWWLPDGDTHFQHYMRTRQKPVDGRLSYQYGKYQAGLGQVKRRGLALDIGAHVGFWSYWLARDFEQLVAFEPLFGDCWEKNVPKGTLFRVALGESPGLAMMERHRDNSGMSAISDYGDVVRMERLDDYGFEPDFIKIDCEGYELPVVKGAKETIVRSRPAMVVEQSKSEDAVNLLRALGAKVRSIIGNDWILSFN